MTNREIANRLKITYASVTVATKKLVKSNFLVAKNGRHKTNRRPILYFRYKKIRKRGRKMKANYKGVEFDVNSTEDIDMLLEHATKKVDTVHKSAAKVFEAPKTRKYTRSGKYAKKTPTGRLKYNMVDVEKPIVGKARTKKWWTPKERKWLMENKDTLPISVLAKSLGRKIDAVRQRIVILSKTVKKNTWDDAPAPIPKMTTKKKRKYTRKLSKAAYAKILPDLIKMINEGKNGQEIADKLGVTKRYVFDKAYILRKKGLINVAKIQRVDRPTAKVQKITDEVTGFDFIPKDRQAIFRDFLKSCHDNKATLSVNELIAYGGIAPSEVKSLMIDIFNQQKKLGYKVAIKNDKLVFNQ